MVRPPIRAVAAAAVESPRLKEAGPPSEWAHPATPTRDSAARVGAPLIEGVEGWNWQMLAIELQC
jgi:hypothetical protein